MRYRPAETGQALGFSTINGLPAHVLIVHAVVVFVPLAALGLVASLHPRTSRRFGALVPVVAVIAFGSVLAAMNAGGWLQDHVANTSLVRRHTQLGGQLWPFSAGVLLLSLVTWWRSTRRPTRGGTSGGRQPGTTATTAVVAVLAVAVAVASVVQVVRIGDSGSRAAWHDHFSSTLLHDAGRGQ